ncbi:MAG: lysophospholipid acyltransferase family protein [Phycisphaeraceae bacterium]|nr:lysophospholipid acyltransferase family protein [Phycisphaeraceae bacterium]
MERSHASRLQPPPPGEPFRIDVPPDLIGWRATLFRAFRPLIARLLGMGRLNRVLFEVRALVDERTNELDALNQVTGIHPLISPHDLARIPASGPLVIVSNHPYGGVDPQILATTLLAVRPDVRFVANRYLATLPFVGSMSFFVDVFGGKEATAFNAAAMHEATRWVSSGGCLCLFPAGEVAHLKWGRWGVQESPWNASAVRLARWANASILPIFVDGRNSTLFQVLGLLHPVLRTMRLPREYFRMMGRGVRVRVGSVLSPAQQARFGNHRELAKVLQVRSKLLGSRRADADGLEPRRVDGALTEASREIARRHRESCEGVDGLDHADLSAQQPVPLVSQHEPAELAAEVAALPPESLLLRQGDYEVRCTKADRIPLLMLEMGRLREITFRAVGEGSGRAIDIDRFDRHYHQLFVWNGRRQELVGAYRMGLTDEILPSQGIDGLYTSTLFEYAPRVMEQLGPAIELGRSYVRREYQRKPLPLLLLWRGIAEFIGRHPRYVIVFGPVSISDEYLTTSKKLMMAFLETHRALARVVDAVRPRNPPRLGAISEIDPEPTKWIIRDLDQVDQVVRDLENGERAVPVLLRQYLRMNAKLLAFNVDPDFGNVVDALMFADIRTLHPRIQDFYLGREKAAAFRRAHALDDAPRSPRR